MRALGVLRRGIVACTAIAVAASCGGGGDGITVTGGGAVAGLRFTLQPSGTGAGTAFTVIVELTTSNGARAATATDVVQLSISGGATLSGSATSKAAVAGVATFDGLMVTKAGTGYQITASAAGFTASSSAFTVTPGSPSAAQSSVTVAAFSVNVAGTTVFTFKDAHGNLMTAVPVSLTTTLAGATFTPSSGTTDAEGKFSTSFLATVAGNAIVRATVAGVAFDFAVPLVISAAGNPCTPVALTFPGVVNGTISASSCITNTFPGVFYRFTAPGTSAVRFGVQSTFTTPQIEVMSDPPGTNLAWNDADGNVTAEWLLPAGTFQARVSSRSGNGTYSLTGTTQNLNNTACTATGAYPPRNLVVSITLAQNLAATDCPFGDGSFFDEFYLSASVNKTCTITLQSTAFTPWLQVEDAITNDVLFANGGAGTVTNNRAACSNNGSPILILANSAETNGVTGAYTLTVTITGGGSEPTADVPPDPMRGFVNANLLSEAMRWSRVAARSKR